MPTLHGVFLKNMIELDARKLPLLCKYCGCHFAMHAMLGRVMIALHYMQNRSQKTGHKTPHPRKPHFHPHLFIVFLQRSKVFSSFGELAFFHAFTHIMMHEGTLRIPGQTPFLIGDTGPKNHKAMTRFWIQSQEPIRQKRSARGKNSWGIATKPAGDSIAIGTWKENCFPPSWHVSFGSVTYFVIPGCNHARSLPAWVRTEGACFYLKECHTLLRLVLSPHRHEPWPLKNKKANRIFRSLITRNRVIPHGCSSWSDQVQKGLKNAFWPLHIQLSKHAPQAQARNVFELKIVGAFSSLNRRNGGGCIGEERTRLSQMLANWSKVEDAGQICPCRAPVSGSCCHGGDIATLWHHWCSVHHQLCSICLNKWSWGIKVSNHSGFPAFAVASPPTGF